MDLRSVFDTATSAGKTVAGKAKASVQDAGEEDKDLLDTMESGSLDVIDSGEGFGPEAEDGEDMISQLEQDMDDGAFDMDLGLEDDM